MSSRLSTSQPVTIETELIPLVDNFWLEANGQTEQWYYDNTGEYAPDRSIIPLIITPYIKATDTDSQTTYTPNFLTERMEWYVQQWNGTAWARTKVTNTTDTPANPFVIVGNTLKVNKNVESPQYGITIECEAIYIDPRDAGVTYPVRDSLTLTMNKDATVPYPKIQVLAESAQSFNPLKDSTYINGQQKGYYDFHAEADWKGVSSDNGSLMYKADTLGTEEIVSRTGTLPTTTPIIGNLRYGKGGGSTLKENQSFMFRQTSGGTVNPVPDNLASVEKVKGNTVVWQQLLQSNRKYSHLESNGITWDVLTDGTVVANGRATALSEFVIYEDNGVTGFIGIVGHKYYSSILIDGTTAGSNTYYARIIDNGGGIKSDWGLKTISTCTAAIGSGVKLRIVSGNTVNNLRFLPLCFDLTLMFGVDNEPTVAQFEAMFPEPYYAYDAGRLLSFNPAGLKTVGFNLWDGRWKIGYYNSDNGEYVYNTQWRCIVEPIRVLPSTKYCYRSDKGGFGVMEFYDESMGYLGYKSNPTLISSSPRAYEVTTPEKCHYITLYWNTATNICINISNASKNGTYESYWENNLQIPITTLKGKVVTNGVAGGSDVVMFPDGLCSAGSVYDEIDLKNGRAVKRLAKINLGQQNDWVRNDTVNGGWQFKTEGRIGGKIIDASVTAVGKSNKYLMTNANNAWNLHGDSMAFVYGTSIRVHDEDYSTADAFKTAMQQQNVEVIYELATPIEYTFDPIPQGQWEWYGVSNGVEVKIDTLPSYVSGQGTDTLRVDALYDENMTVICRYRKFPWDAELIPQKEYRMVAWRIPNIDTIVVCKNGSSVNSASTGSYTFETIVNVKGEQLSDEVKAANLRFNWKMRKSNTTTETDLGWGLTKSIPVSDLKSTVVNGNPVSTIVYCEVYLLGAYEPVTNNGVTTYERTIDLS